MAAHELTEKEIETIKEEIAQRQKVDTPRCIAEVQRTRALGDLSENDEYRTAKRELNRNYSRINYLKRMLENYVVVSYESDEDKIGLFDTVTFRDEDEEDEEERDRTVTLTTPLRHDVLNGKISKDSPLGKSLLGHSVGDKIQITTETGYSYYVTIMDLTKGLDDDNSRIN